jgi:hypothetical protein
MTDQQKSARRLRMVLVCLVLGLAIAGGQAMGGNTKGAIANLVVYGAIVAWFAFGKGEFLDTLLQLDERQKDIVGKARGLTAVLMAWLLVGWAVFNFAHGNFSGPAVVLCCVMGPLFLLSVLFYHFRT